MKRHAVAVTNAANVVVNNVVIVVVEIVVRRYSGLQGSCSITSSHTTTINNNSPQTPLLSPIEIATTVIFSLSRPGAINNWSSGINFINELLQQQHVPP